MIPLTVVKSIRITLFKLEIFQLTREGAVATIMLNRPEAGNALSHQMASELKQVAEALDQDASVRAV
ncbi:MAG: enoyl-CoA hydratase-related protein, partial [Pedosphaera sp.]|nr:enoyl-CoA hydratase-related protein [Pedosphaera sp.]